MPEIPIINRNNALPPSEDYDFLRKEAIQFIQRLSGSVWTDYNTHDPGITLLEAICYSLTDLGYRTSFDVKDLLEPKTGTPESREASFYTAGEILPVNPVTLTDFRKLVIDTDGVKNAWVEISDEYETPVYIVEKSAERKAGDPLFELTQDPTRGARLLPLKGLYKVYLEYESDVLDEQREDEVASLVGQKLNAHRNLCEDFVSITAIEYELFQIEAVLQVNEGTDIDKVHARVYQVIENFLSPPVTFYSLQQMLDKGYSVDEIFEGPKLRYGFIDAGELEKSERFKHFHLSDIMRLISDIEGVIAIKKFAMPIESQSPLADFTDWIDKAKDRQKTPKLDIDHSIITFIRSGDRHRSASDKKPSPHRVKSIYQFLQSSMFQSRLKGSGHDISVPTGEYMQVDEYFPMQHTLPAAYGMAERYIDVNIDEGSIRAALRQVNKANVEDRSQGNMAQQNALPRKMLNIAEATSTVLKKPVGEITGKEKSINNNIDEIKSAYYQLQISSLDKRKKLALQLRGFLMVFEQIMADYLSQLSNVRELLSFREGTKQTYYPQPLHGINDIEALFIDYNRYKKSLLQLVESENEFLHRRNAVLDHLMARFSESMARYEAYVQRTLKSQADERLRADKSLFLSDYIKISNYRGSGFDYTNGADINAATWENDNVEGFKKRVCRLLGIRDYTRKIIASDAIYIAKTGIDENITRFEVVLADPDDRERILLRSRAYEFESEAREILNYMLENGAETRLYERSELKNERAYNLVKMSEEDDNEVIAGMEFHNKDEQQLRTDFEESFSRTMDVLSLMSEAENFHVVEHLLLRPKIGERESTRKKGQVLNADVVELLPLNELGNKTIVLSGSAQESIYQFRIAEIKEQKKTDKIKWRLSLVKADEVNEILLVHEEFTFYKHVTRRIDYIRNFGSDRFNYKVSTTADGRFTFSIVDKDRQLAASKKNFRLQDEMEAEIMRLVEFFSFEASPVEEEDDGSAEVIALADPYSFRVTVVLPSWPTRFRDPTFKHLLEKALYMELPAHIHAQVYWVDHFRMKEFEEAYRLWIQALAEDEIPDTEIVNNMVYALKLLKS
ncbi:hypothetical protein EXU57_06655 [Segetibacter sp. 3557_3]|uniref:hypothetical protein n=1 Tax=Segetibacter sp. 3557_3 TaxID=2547429 RepID=UPI0010588BC1|nr:hypothetical protein [Segetibacter sp. 3557_3]TDH27265.1 hypothetical protein EXU57_06655 [Segetibacter sp. 3557_3]